MVVNQIADALVLAHWTKIPLFTGYLGHAGVITGVVVRWTPKTRDAAEELTTVLEENGIVATARASEPIPSNIPIPINIPIAVNVGIKP